MTGIDQEQEAFSAFDENIWTPEERKYVYLLDEAVRERGIASFSNAGFLHAAHIIRRFFLGAKKEVRIFSGNLSRYGEHVKGSEKVSMKVYADEGILSAMGAFLAFKNTKLRIVVEKEELDGGTDSHPLVIRLNELRKDNKLKGSCKIAWFPDAEKHPRRCHMTVMDRSAYRLETDHAKAKALVCFGDPLVTGKLIDVFDNSIWKEDKLLWSSASAAE